MKIQLNHKFEDIVSVENLLAAWKEFVRGKRKKRDVQEFALNLMDNLFDLHYDLVNHTYKHGDYQAFNITDPKPRNIHKASVRDRVLHHAIYRQLYPFFDRTFIADSFSCRINKGTHKALNRFREFGRKASSNHSKTVWVLKMDIKKFFASIDQKTLLEILRSYISTPSSSPPYQGGEREGVMWLLEKVIESLAVQAIGQLSHDRGIVVKSAKGLPLGNLTSQLFCNVYLNEFDQFVKHKLRVKHYIRYCDDFVIFSRDRGWLETLVLPIHGFLSERLHLELHPEKVFIMTVASGVDFLGWVHFHNHRLLRTATKRRMLKRIIKHPANGILQSYLGLLGHGNTHRLGQEVLNHYGLLFYL